MPSFPSLVSSTGFNDSISNANLGIGGIRRGSHARSHAGPPYLVRARSHAAHSGASRGRPRACPLARGALWRAPRALLCVPVRAQRSWARPEGAPARARSCAAHPGGGNPEGASVRARSHAAYCGVR